jgi:hypothetical protein
VMEGRVREGEEEVDVVYPALRNFEAFQSAH